MALIGLRTVRLCLVRQNKFVAVPLKRLVELLKNFVAPPRKKLAGVSLTPLVV
jgi:hypothetical protein